VFLNYSSFVQYDAIVGGDVTIYPSAYTGIKFNGEIEVDNIHVINRILSSEEILALNPIITPTWIVGETLFLATFDTMTLAGGNVGDLLDTIIKINVYRKKVNDTVYELLSEIDGNAIEYLDYSAYSRADFEYGIVPVTETALGDLLPSNIISVKLKEWYILSTDGTISYKLCLGLNTESFINNTDISELNTVGRYNVYNKGNKNFISSSMSVIPAEDISNNFIYQTTEFMNNFEEFMLNGEKKIIKSPKGEIFNIVVTRYDKSILNNGERTQLYVVSFDFSQVE